MAASLSPMLLGQQIEGVWHTSIVVDGADEYFFGYGVSKARAGTTMFGTPHHKLDLGTTEVPREMVAELVAELATSRFTPTAYQLISMNCTHFAHELAQLLVGEGLPVRPARGAALAARSPRARAARWPRMRRPRGRADPARRSQDYIMRQADVLFNTPWGQALAPMVLAMEGVTGSARAGEAVGAQAAAPAAPAASAPDAQGAQAAATSARANAGMAALARAAGSSGAGSSGGTSSGAGSSGAGAGGGGGDAGAPEAAAGKAAEAVAADSRAS
ncbi:Desi1 [Scenedesmus sp. PABB004]|nr:Desi1 [Scenedesmus sp. PABB004]